jgi:hypothetical protein
MPVQAGKTSYCNSTLEQLEAEAREVGKGCGPIRSQCRRGSGGSGNRVSGKAYVLALACLASACGALPVK